MNSTAMVTGMLMMLFNSSQFMKSHHVIRFLK
jgi:hypothetical protein